MPQVPSPISPLPKKVAFVPSRDVLVPVWGSSVVVHAVLSWCAWNWKVIALLYPKPSDATSGDDCPPHTGGFKGIFTEFPTWTPTSERLERRLLEPYVLSGCHSNSSRTRGDLRWTPHPVIVTIRDNRDHIRVLLYSDYTTITKGDQTGGQ